ncbi:MAG: alpha-N-arabinofuranosidase [Chloroflexi bacterium]|nr:MAG: alpha-N-arabinofuranosidase [Chloroflexota bacterium]MBA4374987.1 hypothetical protein [Anaerolinea sp.]
MAIPEFVLRKLVVQGSLKKKGSGFSFILNNTFAPATIQRIELFVGDSKIPPQSIVFSTSDMPTRTADEIVPENPIFTPVGLEILISVSDHPLNGFVTVKATTKEVGEIVFSISDSKTRKRIKKIKPYWLTRFSKPINAQIEIDLTKQNGSISPFLLGQFVEHLERCVYDGIWTSDGSQLRLDTLDLIQQLNPPIIRYPGGNFASGYHWEDGIGPKDKRPCRHDAAWQAEESNLVGTDEFLAFCETIGAEPFLVVNDGSGTPEEAAHWVAYCNQPETTDQGKRRTANGHAEPYCVKYWGIGNEVWGAWQIGTTNAEEYSRRLLRFIKAMKTADSSIKIIAVGSHPLTDDANDPALLWNKEVLSKAGDQIDYLSWHVYQPEKDGWNEHAEPHQLFQSICAAPLDLDTYIKRVATHISQFSPNKHVLQALDEWNVWLPPLEGETSMHHVTYSMRDALYVASALAVFYRNNQTLGMANLAQLVNVLPLIQTNPDSAIATSIFYPFILFNQMESILVPSLCSVSDFNSKPMGENISAHENVPFLDHLVTISEDQTRITMIFINRHAEKRMKVSFLMEGTPSNAMEISANHPLASNSFKHPNKVKIIYAVKPKLENGFWQVVLKPASITFLEYKRK